jgi:hypothetical protein
VRECRCWVNSSGGRSPEFQQSTGKTEWTGARLKLGAWGGFGGRRGMGERRQMGLATTWRTGADVEGEHRHRAQRARRAPGHQNAGCGVHVVNAGLTVYISKKFNYTLKTPNTKVWAGIPGYNFCKGRHMLWGVVWLGTRVEVGPMQNLEKLCIMSSTKILGIYHSEFGMPPTRWNVFLEIMNKFLIGRFCCAYAKFWERARLLQGGLGF